MGSTSVLSKKISDFTNHKKKTNKAIIFSCRSFPTFLNTWNISETFQQSGKQAEPHLENWGSIQYRPKTALFLKNKNTKNFTNPYSIPFLSVLHQNETLHNLNPFTKRGQRLIVRHIKDLD